MERIDRIVSHEKYQAHLSKIGELEQERVFCKHQMEHFLSVARIAMLIKAEEELPVERELIYAAALLHDIGRGLQYQTGVPHERASAEIAAEILADCFFNEPEALEITQAILGHRDSKSAGLAGLSGLLYRADKLSRDCFCCGAKDECDKPLAARTLKINY